MTTDIESLIEALASRRSGRGQAIDELAQAGERALPAVVAAIERRVAVPLWTAVLIALRMPSKAAALAAHLRHPDHTVRAAILRALGRSDDPGALDPLIAELKAGEPVRILATALGDLGDVRALGPLRDAAAALVGTPLDLDRLSSLSREAANDESPSDLLAVAEIAESLSKLGDMSLAPALIQLVAFVPARPAFYEAARVRHAAARALTVTVAPGVSHALHRACRDGDEDVWIEALGATVLLGRAAEIEHWLAMLGDASLGDERRWEVAKSIAETCGESPVGDDDELPTAQQVDRWWARTFGRFEPAVCYRAGEPAFPGQLLPGLIGKQAGLARRELRVMTGLPMIQEMLGGEPATPAELAVVTAWWAARQCDFPPGKLHRWGRTYEPTAVDGSV